MVFIKKGQKESVSTRGEGEVNLIKLVEEEILISSDINVVREFS